MYKYILTYFTEVANVLSGHSFIFNSAVLKDRFASKNGLLSQNNWKLTVRHLIVLAEFCVKSFK